MDSKMTISEFNMEDLFIHLEGDGCHLDLDQLSTLSETDWKILGKKPYRNKKLKKIFDLAQVVLEIDADIYALCEIGGPESIQIFCSQFLNGKYKPLLIEGNSDRGIDVGYLIKNKLTLETSLKSHRDRPLPFVPLGVDEKRHNNSPLSSESKNRFSRDVLELRLTDPRTKVTKLVLLLTHLKSQRNAHVRRQDGRMKREAEIRELTKIYVEVQNDVGAEVPIIVTGDFNGNAQSHNPGTEFRDLFQETDLRDTLELADIPIDYRYTYIQVRPNGRSSFLQLDYILASNALHNKIEKSSCYVYRFKNANGEILPPPINMEEKSRLPSDHYPVVITFKF